MERRSNVRFQTPFGIPKNQQIRHGPLQADHPLVPIKGWPASREPSMLADQAVARMKQAMTKNLAMAQLKEIRG